MPGRRVRDSGFFYITKVNIKYQGKGETGKGTDERWIRSPHGVVVSTQIWRGGKVYAADGDFGFFGDFGPVGSCFGVGVCVVFTHVNYNPII
jgi:hypothetical protein